MAQEQDLHHLFIYHFDNGAGGRFTYKEGFSARRIEDIVAEHVGFQPEPNQEGLIRSFTGFDGARLDLYLMNGSSADSGPVVEYAALQVPQDKAVLATAKQLAGLVAMGIDDGYTELKLDPETHDKLELSMKTVSLPTDGSVLTHDQVHAARFSGYSERHDFISNQEYRTIGIVLQQREYDDWQRPDASRENPIPLNSEIIGDALMSLGYEAENDHYIHADGHRIDIFPAEEVGQGAQKNLHLLYMQMQLEAPGSRSSYQDVLDQTMVVAQDVVNAVAPSFSDDYDRTTASIRLFEDDFRFKLVDKQDIDLAYQMENCKELTQSPIYPA